MTTVLKTRLDALPNITLYRGAHSAPSATAPSSDIELCVNELVSFLANEPWSDQPDCQCPVIGAAMMRFNDRVDDETRQKLVAYDTDPMSSLAARSIGTRGDGHQTQRGHLAADFAVRVALPIWLDVAGHADDATRLRALPELVDPESSRAAYKVVREIRKGLPDWWEYRKALRKAVYDKVYEAVARKPDAATATAAATAADAATATAGGWQATYDAVYPVVRAKLDELYGRRWPAAREQANAEFLKLLDRMVALGEDDRQVQIAA